MILRTLVAQRCSHLILAFLLLTCLGCGTTKSQQVTEQLLMSDAVDRSVAGIDFSVLKGKQVYLDTRHLRPVKLPGFVNADYIISSLRQQMFAAEVRLIEKQEDADIIVEARVGALGTNSHEITYGMPANNVLTAAATIMPNSPPIPTIPELSLARRSDQVGGAKIALFAYDVKTKQPVWQSGVNTSMSNVRHFWVLGAGPFQRGTIYDGTSFAGSKIKVPLMKKEDGDIDAPAVAYNQKHTFPDKSKPQVLEGGVQLSSYHEEESVRIKKRTPKQPPVEDGSESPDKKK